MIFKNDEYKNIINFIAETCGVIANMKGFNTTSNHITQMLLISTEVAEAIENFIIPDDFNNDINPLLKKFKENMDHIEDLRKTKEISETGVTLKKENNLPEELADIIIRVLSYSFNNKIDIGQAIINKINVNLNREHKHGKMF